MGRSKLIGSVINDFEILDNYLKTSDTGKSKHTIYILKCTKCGEITERESATLKEGKSRCRCSYQSNHHKLSNTDLYKVYNRIKARCYNKSNDNYKWYGERGISMCEEWKNDFQAFYNWAINNGYKKELSIDRIDVNGDYAPDNCRWVSQTEQCNNKRNNIYYEYNVQKLTLKQWSRIVNIRYETLRGRIERGWTIEQTLEIPSSSSNRKIGKEIYKNGKRYNAMPPRIADESRVTG